jgi:MarR family transcriptional regulator, organic hydroperoxide resistance regulator
MERLEMVKASRSAQRTAVVSDGKPESRRQEDVVRRFLLDLASINVHLDEIRQFWAKSLGVSGPQWVIMMALSELDRGQGVSGKDVSKLLHIDPSFITTQTKLLERAGLIRRLESSEDARVILLSLSDKALRQIGSLTSKQELLNKFIFADMDGRALGDMVEKIASLKEKLQRATSKIAAEF